MPRRTRRNFTPGFKAQVSLELFFRQRTSAELRGEHPFGACLLTAWNDTALSGLPSLVRAEEQGSQKQAPMA